MLSVISNMKSETEQSVTTDDRMVGFRNAALVAVTR